MSHTYFGFVFIHEFEWINDGDESLCRQSTKNNNVGSVIDEIKIISVSRIKGNALEASLQL